MIETSKVQAQTQNQWGRDGAYRITWCTPFDFCIVRSSNDDRKRDLFLDQPEQTRCGSSTCHNPLTNGLRMLAVLFALFRNDCSNCFQSRHCTFCVNRSCGCSTYTNATDQSFTNFNRQTARLNDHAWIHIPHA